MRRKHPAPFRHHPLLLILLLVLPAAAPLHAVSSGILLLTTSTLDSTQIVTSLEGDFFGTGSDPMPSIRLILRGEPIRTQTGTPSLGTADTVIRIPEEHGVTFSLTQPETLTVPIHIQAINLVSAVPLIVTYNHGARQEAWDVRVCLATNLQKDGILTLTNDCKTSGTFVSSVSLRPRIIFSRISDRYQVLRDREPGDYLNLVSTGFWVNRSITAGELLSVAPGALLDKNCDGVFDSTMLGTTDIALGVARVGCNWFSPNQGYLALRPFSQAVKAVQSVQPTLSAGRSFPLEGEQ
jgi:hypothetical protein